MQTRHDVISTLHRRMLVFLNQEREKVSDLSTAGQSRNQSKGDTILTAQRLTFPFPERKVYLTVRRRQGTPSISRR